MTLIVGLGNPGAGYRNTKHNFGFWVVDQFVQNRSLKYKSGKGDYLYAKSGDLILAKPTTYRTIVVLQWEKFADILMFQLKM